MAKLAMQFFFVIGILLVLALVFGLVEFNAPLQGGVQNIPTIPAENFHVVKSILGL